MRHGASSLPRFSLNDGRFAGHLEICRWVHAHAIRRGLARAGAHVLLTDEKSGLSDSMGIFDGPGRQWLSILAWNVFLVRVRND